MRISFSCSLKYDSGKQNFAIRLSREFKRMGIKVTGKFPDVNLVFVNGFKKRCKNILRLDGIWMNTKFRYKKKNKKIQKSISKSDGIIYQNYFCKQATDKFCGRTKKSFTCIFNGANPNDFFKKSDYGKPFFFAACRWRPHKRLKEIVDGFIYSDLERDYDLIIAGIPDYIVAHPGVKYLGKISTEETQKYTASCVGYVHLAYIDWCPNSVVEALVAGKPVLFANSGGTGELVKNNGVAIEDGLWNFKAIDHYNPPCLDKTKIAEGYRSLLEVEQFKREDLYISNIAKQYKEFIMKIINL